MTRFHFILRVGLGALSLLSTARSAQSTKLPAKENFHLFLLVGQSNMAGRGTVTPEDKKPLPRILMLNQAGEWVPAIDPLHFDKPTAAGVGIGRSFAQVIAETNPDITIGLIPCAVGGSPIDAWKPGVYYAPTKSHPWDDAIKRAKVAQQSGTLKGILWHQGESDATSTLAPAYEAKLHDLVARFRTELQVPRAPFIAGQLGRFPERPWDQFKSQVDAAHRSLPQAMPPSGYVSAEGLTHRGDHVHFDSDSYREFGRRYAAAYLKLWSEK